MNIVYGAVVTLVSLIGWGGQCIACLAPRLAVRLQLTENEQEVDPAFYADARGEAVWDALTLWILPVAGVLLMMKSVWWPYFGLAGGAVYVYFAGRGIAVRVSMQHRGIRIGNPGLSCLFLAIWGLLGAATMIGGLLVATGMNIGGL